MNLDQIVSNSIDGVLKTQLIKEAYVVEPAVFTLPTEKLSDKTKTTRLEHFDTTVAKLNQISAELDGASREDAKSPISSEYRNLKMAESFAINDAFLQGEFLANVADQQSSITMDMLCFMRLTRDFGTFDAWQKDFIAAAMSSRHGYAVTAYSIFLRRYINFIIDDANVGVPFGAYPVIVLDVSEGCYYKDYLGNREAYVQNMMREFNWREIEGRFKKSDKIAKVTK